MLYVRVCEVDMMHRCNEMRLLKKRINIMKVAKLHSTRFIIKKSKAESGLSLVRSYITMAYSSYRTNKTRNNLLLSIAPFDFVVWYLLLCGTGTLGLLTVI